MKALVFGSLNIDKVYTLAALPEKGETLTSEKYEIHVGGKGLNQSLSLAYSGMNVYMAGQIGSDGIFLKEYLEKAGVNTDFIKITDGFTGHAVIEVDRDGQNQMILFPGANRKITAEYCDEILKSFSAGDLILMQYETSQVEYMIKKAHDKGLKVALNPSPYTEKLKALPYDMIDFLILNEFEGQSISGESETDKVISKLCPMLGNGSVILTLGGDGAMYSDGRKTVKVPAFKVNAVDTTGAGDTFTGYVLNALLGGKSAEYALTFASGASAIAVTKSGAAETIPTRDDVVEFLERNGKNV